MNVSIEVSVGEFLDKLTILQIKSERIKDANKLKSIHKELSILKNTWQKNAFNSNDITGELALLKKTNEALWDIEDQIRFKESQGAFDKEFIELARSVYINNDSRAAVKRKLNIKLGSELMEEKSYVDYQK